MGSEWESFPIGEVCHVTDGAHSKVERQTEGVLYLTSKNIKVGNLLLDKVDYISEKDYDRLFPKDSKAQRRPVDGDILIGIIGTFGNAYRYKKEDLFGVSSSVAIIRPNNLRLDSNYLYYVVTSPTFKAVHTAYKSGSVQGYTNIPTIKTLPLPIPPLPEQKAIAHILGSLDNKIELNRQINETLEAMAQALFKSWFVDFDPVIDNALAAGNPIPDVFAERAKQRQALTKQRKTGGVGDKNQNNPAIQEAFPNAFEYTEEMGWIPEGWGVGTIKDESDVISKGTTPSKKIMENSTDTPIIPFLKVRNLDDKGKINIDGLSLIPESVHEKELKRSILKTGDILFSIAGTIGRIAMLPAELNNSNSNQALAFIRPIDKTKANFLLQLLKSDNIQSKIKSKIVQAVQANVSLTELGGLEFTKATDEIYRIWHLSTKAIFEKSSYLQNETITLTKLRDTLLPKLLSGELRIPEAEKLVEEAIA